MTIDGKLFVKAIKCLFHCTTISFLEYVIIAEEVKIDNKKVGAVTEYHIDNSTKNVFLRCMFDRDCLLMREIIKNGNMSVMKDHSKLEYKTASDQVWAVGPFFLFLNFLLFGIVI